MNETQQHHLLSAPDSINREHPQLVLKIMNALNQGDIRVAHKDGQNWHTNPEVKAAILAYFQIQDCTLIKDDHSAYFDKIPTKYQQYQTEDFLKDKVRVAPGAVARFGAYIGPHCVLMPSFVNIGAYIDHHTMIDTFASIGSCAQIGAHCHISAGAGIGGVLEPMQANPTIIEDHVFVGARSEIVEGMIIKQGAVIGMGVFLSPSTKVYDRVHQTTIQGYIPKDAVVVPGSRPSQDGSHGISTPIIVKYADQKTRGKLQLNDILRPD